MRSSSEWQRVPEAMTHEISDVELVPDYGFARVPSVAPQRRDQGGRFAGARRRRRPSGRRASGRSGESRLARLSHTALVKRLVVLEHKVGRLEAEIAGLPWSDPVETKRLNVTGLRRVEAERVEKRVRALEIVLEDLSLDRDDAGVRDPERLAKAMSARLDKPVTSRTLYRSPYREMWDENWIVPSGPETAAAGAARLGRLPRRMLIHHIRRREERLDALLRQRREAIAQVSRDDPDAWTRLPRPQPRGSNKPRPIVRALAARGRPSSTP